MLLAGFVYEVRIDGYLYLLLLFLLKNSFHASLILSLFSFATLHKSLSSFAENPILSAIDTLQINRNIDRYTSTI